MTAPTPSLTRMARRLTTPFARGADTLELRLERFSSSQVTVPHYDFADHAARFGGTPEQPRYVLTTTRDIDVDTTVQVLHEEPGQPQRRTDVLVRAGTLAGTSFLLEEPVTGTARVFFLTMVPEPFDNAPDRCWTLTALLGNTAKLLWVLGAERDQLRRHAVRTLAQRHLPTAAGVSLDLIGADLGVPRFPPLPYGFDTDTVALYHLDDDGLDRTATDATAAYPGRAPGHPGRLSGAVQVGLPGRYDRAMGFRSAEATIEIPADAAFDIGDHRSDGATMECFVRPDPDPGRGPVENGPVLSRDPGAGDGRPGWVVAVGRFGRGIPRNVRFTASDGDVVVELFADLSLPTGTFSHVAAVVDHLTGVAALYVDGVRRDWRFISGLGAIAGTEPVRIGGGFLGVVDEVRIGGGFLGVVDEVRISSAARTGPALAVGEFAPALGEGDEHYRRRLELFRRWSLPTPANLTAILNELVGPIGGAAGALVVDDTNATLVRGTRLVRVRPKALLPGESIDAAGRRGGSEASVVGTAEAEDAFDPGFLLRLDRTDVDFTPPVSRVPPPGAPAPDPHLVQVGVAERLNRLVTLAAARPGPAGRLVVDAAFDPRAGDLRATGRAVLLRHTTIGADVVAALAHRAGFDFVGYRAGAGQVYAAAAAGDYFAIDLDPAAAGAPTDVDAGRSATLSLRPAPPPGAVVRWLVVPGGAGRGTLTPGGGAGSAHPTASLAATAPGRLIVKADVTRGRHTVSATRELRIGLADLPAGETIAADGGSGVAASTLDDPDAFFHPAFLKRHNDPRVDYGDAATHLMQPAVADLLDALLAELGRRNIAGRLRVVAAFTTGDPDDHAAAQGRKLVLRHDSLAPGALAGPAFAVGFGHLAHAGDTLQVVQAPGQLVAVGGPDGTDQGAIIELDEGDAPDLTAFPPPENLPPAELPGEVPGERPRLSWASGAFDDARVTLGSNSELAVALHADRAGMAWVQASYLVGGQPAPYTFQVRLRPDLDTPLTVIAKEQHDLIMNVLNALHPIGVEVITAAIRSHVIELRDDRAPANPAYTYPKFRVRGTLPPQVRRPADG